MKRLFYFLTSLMVLMALYFFWNREFLMLNLEKNLIKNIKYSLFLEGLNVKGLNAHLSEKFVLKIEHLNADKRDSESGNLSDYYRSVFLKNCEIFIFNIIFFEFKMNCQDAKFNYSGIDWLDDGNFELSRNYWIPEERWESFYDKYSLVRFDINIRRLNRRNDGINVDFRLKNGYLDLGFERVYFKKINEGLLLIEEGKLKLIMNKNWYHYFLKRGLI
jgi:hypothetical protein